MRWAVVSDVHGNLAALESCLAEIKELSCGRLLCLGDTFGYFPEGRACHELLRRSGAESLLGNHEAMLLGVLPVRDDARDVYRHEVLGDDCRAELSANLPWQIEDLPGGKHALLVHGTPHDPLEGYAYPDSDLAVVAGPAYDLVLMGNTHRPFVSTSGSTLVANVGSVGMPRDDGAQGSFAVVDTESLEVEICRFPLDLVTIRDRYMGRVHPSVLELMERRP